MSSTAITIPISGTIDSGLALMYIDPLTESLKEIDTNHMFISCYPYESVIRRFYLCGDILSTTANITVTANMDSIHEDDYTVQVLMGMTNPRRSDFSDASNSFTTSYGTSADYFANAIAVDILLTSNLRSESTSSLIITINAQNASPQQEQG